MYTVVRFTGKHELLEELTAIGHSMNLLRPGIFFGLRKRGDGFGCEICNDDLWVSHASAIDQFIVEFATPIERAVKLGAQVTIDVAVWSEDRNRQQVVLVVNWDHGQLSALAAAGIEVEVSVYC